jgi:hypothetical protein
VPWAAENLTVTPVPHNTNLRRHGSAAHSAIAEARPTMWTDIVQSVETILMPNHDDPRTAHVEAFRLPVENLVRPAQENCVAYGDTFAR